MNRQALGHAGEKRAARFLRKEGLGIIARNWRCSAGEIDIVARDGDTLVIVEVRSSQSSFAGLPELTVGPQKQRRLVILAQHYLDQCKWRPDSIRIDVVGVSRRGLWKWDIRWYREAFSV